MSLAAVNKKAILPLADHIEILPQSGYTGAEIRGLDLKKPLSAPEIDTIKSALNQWGVVYFRDQHLDHAEQIRFGRQFGKVTPGHPYEGDVAPQGFPEIHTVSPAAYDKRYGTNYRKYDGINGPGWHAEVTPLINPPAYSILRAEKVPAFSGDTQFTNVAAAYKDLSKPLQALIDKLQAEHRFGVNVNAAHSPEKIGDWVRSKPLASIHPVVRLHPETGERVIYVNPTFTKQIIGLSPRESRHILDLLYEHISHPKYTDRFKWQPGSIAFWDNRLVLHLAPRDYEHLDFERILHRITLEGEIPVGTTGERSTSLAGDAFLGL